MEQKLHTPEGCPGYLQQRMRNQTCTSEKVKYSTPSVRL